MISTTDIPPFIRQDFGEDFEWGIAISAFQNEGAWNQAGKGSSIWDIFSHKKGKIKDNANADTACDFYHLYRQDISLAASLGFKIFRFSISWSRIFPEGKGKINQAGIRFYHEVIDAVLQAGMIPYVTLYHWDLPQALEEQDGWMNRGIFYWFSDYVSLCAREFGDKVKH